MPSKGKIIFMIIINIPRLLFVIPVMLFRIAKGIIWVNRNWEKQKIDNEEQEKRLCASYENALISLIESDESKGYAYRRAPQDLAQANASL